MKKFFRKILSLTMIISMLVSIVLLSSCSSNVTSNTNNSLVADKIVYGNIITMDEKNPKAEAMAIKDGKIVFLGSKDDAKSFLDSKTIVYDNDSKFIYPGLIDVHSHIGLLSTMMAGGPQFPQDDTYENNIRDLTEYIKQNPGKEIYKAYGFTSDSIRGLPTHDMLDAIEIDGKKFDKPIFISEISGHLSWLNKPAMDLFGVNKDMVKKYGEDVVPCDENGEPIGCIKETPNFAAAGSIPVELEDAKQIFMDFQDIHLSHGYSMVGDCGLDENANPMITAMGELDKEGKLKLKIRGYYQIFETCEDPLKEVDRAIEYAKQYNSENFKIVGIKIFLDGVSEGLSSWTISPYADYKFKGEPYYGYKRWDYDRIDELVEIIKKANANGLSMQFHAYGTGSARYALDAIEKAQEGIENPDFRNAVSHLPFIDKEDIPRFAKLNVMPVVAPHWYIFDKFTVGAEKIIYGDPGYLDMGPMQSYLNTGANLSFHSDGAPDTEPSLMVFAAVNKYDPIKDPNMEPRNINERLSAYDSVKCLTKNSAYVLKEENNVGTLEVGKSADYIVYDFDLTNDEVMSDATKCGLPASALYINGEAVFDKANKIRVDKIITNAKIYTSNDASLYAEACAIKDGKFVYVGDNQGIDKYEGEIVDLNGKFIMPGIIDGHVHVPLSISMDFTPKGIFIEADNKPEALEFIKKTIDENPGKDEYKFYLSYVSLKDEKLTKEDIDSVSGDASVVIVEEEGHSAWGNTKAFNRRGITDDTPDMAPGLSIYERDENGRMTGYMIEMTASSFLAGQSKGITDEQIDESLDKFINFCKEYGVSVVLDAGLPGASEFQEKVYKRLCELDNEGKLPITFEGCCIAVSLQELDEAVENLKRCREIYNTKHVKINTLKVISDGTIGINTAALIEPYADKPDTYGGSFYDNYDLPTLLKELNKEGFNFHAHTVGDRACKQVLDAVEKVKNEIGDEFKIKVTCAHLETAKEEDLLRFAKLGVAADFTPWWHGGGCGGDGLAGEIKKLGEERGRNKFRCKTVSNTGALVGFSNDNTSFNDIELWSPYLGIEIGMTRNATDKTKVPDNEKLNVPFPPESECMTIDEMLKGYTSINAKILNLPNKGSIEVGKDADYLIFDNDLTTAEHEGFSYNMPTEVYFEGIKMK